MVIMGSGSAAMRFHNLAIVIEKEPEEYSPSQPGCFSNGRTIEEARRNMREAMEQHVAALLAQREPVPQNERLVHVEELSIGVPRWRMPQVSARGLVRVLKSQRRARIWPARPLRPALRAPTDPPCRRHGLPRSHGPAEQKVNGAWSTHRYRRPQN
jgi:predicted RNase H-like HicB family nuclease